MNLGKLFYSIFILLLANHLYASYLDRDSSYLNIRVNNDVTTQVQNEEQIVMNPKDTTNLVAVWRDFRLGYRQVGYGYSFDGGLTWGQGLFVEPGYIWQSDPGLTVDTAGNFYAVILSYNGLVTDTNGLFVFRSTDGGMNWTGPNTVINGSPGAFEDKELIACDRSGGPYTGYLYVVWMRFWNEDGIYLCRSTDGGSSFVGPVRVDNNNAFQWPVPCVGPNGEVYVAWIGSELMFDRSFDGGVSFGADIVIQNISYYTGEIYPAIWVMSYPAIDVDITDGLYRGNIYVAYMDDSPGYTDTDIYFTRSTNGGDTWSEKVRINDDQLNNGCDQFHPWITVAKDGSIVVVFLDRRLDPGNLLMDLYMTTSTDGGINWSANERITTVSSDPTAGSSWRHANEPTNPLILADRAGLLGEYVGVTASSINDIHPIWTDTRLGDQDAFVGVKDTALPYVQEITKHDIDGSLTVFPNPAQGIVFIKVSDTKSPSDDQQLTIFGVTGQPVKTFKDPSKLFIWSGYNDHGNLVAKGTYFCRLRREGVSTIKKFIWL